MRPKRRNRPLAAPFALGLALLQGAGQGGGRPSHAAVVPPIGDPTVYCSQREPGENPGKFADSTRRFRPRLPPPLRGPCAVADSFAVLPPLGDHPPLYVTNFGVLFDQGAAPADAGADAATSGRRYGFICEENFGGKLPDHVARHPDGRLLMAGFDGLHIGAAPGSGDVCGFARAGGSVSFKDVAEVGWEPVVPAAGPRRIYALTRTPPALHVSTDDGQSFTQVYAFASELRLSRLFLAPRSGVPAPVIYVAGYAAGQALVVARSADEGASFTVDSFPSSAFGRSGVVALMEGPRPDAPGTLFVATGGASGADEIWRSDDGGHTWANVLTLMGSESRAGFTFGATGNDVFVAGLALIPPADGPFAHLYVSHDGGSTFTSRASPAAGPRFRCLTATANRLYACADPLKDPFMFGVSEDEGATWRPTATLTDIAGPSDCTRGRCAATQFWLCQSYGICTGDEMPPEQRDGVAADGGVVNPVDGSGDVGDVGDGSSEAAPGSGCSCQLAGSRRERSRAQSPGGLSLLVAAASMFFGARAARRRRQVPALVRRST
jgi:hypothetical protein